MSKCCTTKVSFEAAYDFPYYNQVECDHFNHKYKETIDIKGKHRNKFMCKYEVPKCYDLCTPCCEVEVPCFKCFGHGCKCVKCFKCCCVCTCFKTRLACSPRARIYSPCPPRARFYSPMRTRTCYI